MTVSSQQIRVSYNGNGVSTAFPIPFLFYANTDLLVMIGSAVQSSGFTVTGAGLGSGTCTFTTAPANGVTVQVVLSVPFTQLSNFVDGTAFPSATVNQALDRSIQASLRLQDQVGRTLRAPDADSASWAAMPVAASRAGMVLAFDSSGLPTVAQPVSLGQTIAAQQLANFGTDSGVANAYVVAVLGNTNFSLATGTLLRFTPLNANSGPATLNAQSTGVQAIVNQTGGALSGGELGTQGPTWLYWNGSAWQIAFVGITAAQVAALYAPINNAQLTGAAKAADDAGTQQTLGWRDAPQNSQTVSYQLVLADRGKQVAMNGSSLTLTIPANASVAFPVGSVILAANLNASSLSIAITSDTLTKANSTTIGTRTLAQNGIASLMKVGTTSWLISGTGIG